MVKRQSGFAHILGLILLVIGLVAALILVKNPQILKSRATNNTEAFIKDDGGIQTYYNDGVVPQISSTGRLLDHYTGDSFFPLVLAFADLGSKGQPWTVFGLDSAKSRDTLQEVKVAGFNTLLLHWWMPTDAELAYVNTFGFKVFPMLRDLVMDSFLDRNNEGEPINWSNLQSEIRRVKDNPAVLTYLLFDEYPESYNPYTKNVAALKLPYQKVNNDSHNLNIPIRQEQWVQAYDAIKAVDNTKLVMVNSFPNQMLNSNNLCGNTTTTTFDFRPYTDILSFDQYPIGTNNGAKTNNLEAYINTTDQVIVACRQSSREPFFNWVQAHHLTINSDARIDMPGGDQIRSIMYSSIVHGATGLQIFVQHTPWAWQMWGSTTPWNQDDPNFGGINPVVTPEQWRAVSGANKEIEMYKNIFLAKTASDEYHLWVSKTYTNVLHPVQTMLKDTGDPNERYLLVVNIDGRYNNSKFEFKRKINKVTSLFDNSNNTIVIDPSGLLFHESQSTPPFGVKLYKIEFGTTITSGGLTTTHNPWAVWLRGSNLKSDLTVQLFDAGNRWGGDIPITLAAEKTWLSFQLPSNTPPSGCNVNRSCDITVKLHQLNGSEESNSFTITLPASVSSVTPNISGGGVTLSYQPWAVWLRGSNFKENLVAQVFDQGNKWGEDITVSLGADKAWLSLQLPSNTPPSKCNTGKTCQIKVKLYDPVSNVYSNEYSLDLPAAP